MSLANLPDDVTVIRRTGPDQYGNADGSWSSATELPTVKGFQVRRNTLLLPPTADIQAGDRVRVNGVTFDVDGHPEVARSMRKAVLITAKLKDINSA